MSVVPDGALVSRSDVERAAERISGRVRRTPTVRLAAGDLGLPGRLVLKMEHLQHSGSFKVRGAFNRILSAEVLEPGVIAASGGNHGAAVAYAARELGFRAEIFVPEISAAVKVQRLRSYGARVTVVGSDYAEALEASAERAAETGAVVVHAYDQPAVVAGQGTMALEIFEDAPELDTVLIAAGGAGLIGGAAAFYRGDVRLVCVEPRRSRSLAAALEAGKPVSVPVGGIAMDSLGARLVGDIPFELARRFVTDTVPVEDEDIREAQRLAWDAMRQVLEPGGATALAALVSGAYRPAANERVGVVLCGANADPTDFAVK